MEWIEMLMRPYVAWAVSGVVIAQFMKSRILTWDRAIRKGKRRFFWYWARRTLPAHPAVTGLFIGKFWDGSIDVIFGIPVEGGTDFAMFYFFTSGMGSVVVFDLIKGVFKKKWGVTVNLAKASNPPGLVAVKPKSPPPPPPDEAA